MNATTSAAMTIGAVRHALDGRRLVWFGIRGEDGEALLAFPELEASYSVIAPLRSGKVGASANVTLEGISGVRPDLDRFDIDRDAGEAMGAFRESLLRDLSGRCVVVPYRPSALVSALGFSMSDTMTIAGMLKDRQQAFEHKPWVERSLNARGVRGPGWQYVADEHRSRAKRLLAAGPLILRVSRSSGGVGIALVAEEEEIDRLWPRQADAFVAVAPFLANAVPVNFSGCVFSNGMVRLHPPSVQLIGIESCTDRAFGFCGNDFGAVAALGDAVLQQLDAMGRVIGAWLHSERYLGAFGVDALVHEGQCYFTEVNARFQGSSTPSAEIAAELGVSDLFVDHLAANLGVSVPVNEISLSAWARRQPPRSQVIVHNTGDAQTCRDEEMPLDLRSAKVRISQLPHGVAVAPGGSLGRLTLDRSVTSTGFELDAEVERLIDKLRAVYPPVASTQPKDANLAAVEL